VLGYTEGGNWR